MLNGVKLYLPDKKSIPNQIVTFIKTHAHSNWFHLIALDKNCPLSPGFLPLVICLIEKDKSVSGAICAFKILSGEIENLESFISRIRIYGSPLINPTKENQGEILNVLLQSLNHYASFYTKCVEFWNDSETDSLKSLFLSQGFQFSDHLNLIKFIPDKQIIWNSLSTSRRRQIRKATENGSVIREAKSEDEVIQLYQILNNLFTSKIKKKIPSLITFINFFSTSNITGQGVILVVLLNKTVIGGIVCPVMKNKVMYEWYICGLDKDHPKNYPSVMATWAGLAYAADNKIPFFNFLGLGKPETPYGVRDFKLRFGGEIVNYGRYTKSFIETRNP